MIGDGGEAVGGPAFGGVGCRRGLYTAYFSPDHTPARDSISAALACWSGVTPSVMQAVRAFGGGIQQMIGEAVVVLDGGDEGPGAVGGLGGDELFR